MSKYSYTPEVDGQVSEWNEALYKMKRLHDIQTEINVVKISPLIKHYALNKHNYLIWYSLVSALYIEGKADYAQKEIEEMEGIISILSNTMKTLPVFKNVVNQGYSGSRIVEVLNKNNWEITEKLLEIFESQVKYYNNLHGLSTKKVDNMNRSILR